MFRRRNKVYPPLPTSLEDLGRLLEDPRYAERFGTSTDRKPFYRRCQTGTAREGTVLMLISENMKGLMTTSECFHVDGHFKMTPNVPGLYQMLTIMPVSFNHVSSKHFFAPNDSDQTAFS